MAPSPSKQSLLLHTRSHPKVNHTNRLSCVIALIKSLFRNKLLRIVINFDPIYIDFLYVYIL